MYYILKFIYDIIVNWNIMLDARGNRYDHKKPKNISEKNMEISRYFRENYILIKMRVPLS